MNGQMARVPSRDSLFIQVNHINFQLRVMVGNDCSSWSTYITPGQHFDTTPDG